MKIFKIFSIIICSIIVQLICHLKLISQNSDLILTSDTAETSINKVTIFRSTIENLSSVDQHITSIRIESIDNFQNFNLNDFKISTPQIFTLNPGSKLIIEIIFAPSLNYPEMCFRLIVKTLSSEAVSYLCLKNVTNVELGREYNTDFSISPNPASDFITVSIPEINPMVNRRVDGVVDKIQIFNTLGVDLTPPHSINGDGVRINLSHLPSGVYFIKIGDKFEKFVKM